ncbi:MAG: Lcl C-terminal domain-containing protein [Steroidobacteraceae bacterium]
MQTLSNELRSVIEARLRSSSPREILAIASTLCAQELAVAPKPIVQDVRSRFTVDGDTVHDALTGLVWTRETLAGARRKWADAKQAAADCRIGGFTDWRLPTIKELLSIVDYERSEPAIDQAFQCESAWYWSSTPYASSPSDCAWLVGFDYGLSSWYNRSYEGFVRAVRPGQIVGNLG